MATKPAPGIRADLSALIRLRHAARLLDLSRQRKILHDAAGTHRSRFRGRGVEFSEVRAYQTGDDLRDIDWRVTARTRRPHTRLYQEERERPVLIVTDQRREMFFGTRRAFKSVAAAEAAALLAWAGLHNNDRVGGMVFGEDRELDLRPRRSRHAVLGLLNGLVHFSARLAEDASARPETGNPLSRVLRHLVRTARPGSLVALISDFHDVDGDCLRLTRELARHSDLVAICVSDHLERELPRGGQWTFSDGSARLRVDAGTAALRQRYAESRLQTVRQFEDHLNRLRMPLIHLDTGADPAQVLARGLGLAREPARS